MFIQNILAKLADSAADTTEFWSDLYTKRYTSEKIPSSCPLDASTGRSMVEMLGVLAIIGVLSVGAIVGYAKAMSKYKLNQHAQAVNMLINNVLSIKDKLPYNENSSIYYGAILYKMNLIPDGIKYITDSSLKDMWFNETITIYFNPYGYGGIRFTFKPTSYGAEICKNIVTAAKENSSNLWQVETSKFVNDTTSDNNSYIGNLYGDAYCLNDKPCLRDLDLDKIYHLCNECNEKACDLYVLYQ